MSRHKELSEMFGERMVSVYEAKSRVSLLGWNSDPAKVSIKCEMKCAVAEQGMEMTTPTRLQRELHFVPKRAGVPALQPRLDERFGTSVGFQQMIYVTFQAVALFDPLYFPMPAQGCDGETRWGMAARCTAGRRSKRFIKIL